MILRKRIRGGGKQGSREERNKLKREKSKEKFKIQRI